MNVAAEAATLLRQVSIVRLQFVSHFENTRHLVCGGIRQLPLRLSCDSTLESHSAVFDQDVNGRHSPGRIPEQWRIPIVNSAVKGETQFTVSNRNGQDLNLINHLVNAFDFAYAVFRILGCCRLDSFTLKDNSTVRAKLRFQPVENVVIRQGDKFMANCSGDHSLEALISICVSCRLLLECGLFLCKAW